MAALVMKRGGDPAKALASLKAMAALATMVGDDVYGDFEVEARKRLGARDPEDWPVLAAALALGCRIWTEDTDFFGFGIATWTSGSTDIFLAQLLSFERCRLYGELFEWLPRYNKICPVDKTFYIETFGCQMNAHDTEKVIGTLLAKGYAQVDTPEAAGHIFYNTCSIRDKAEQKVFNRLQSFKRIGKGKVFGVLGCVAQQEGEKIFERAPHVSLVAGSASYTRLPEMLLQLEAGNRRVTGLSLDASEAFDTPFTRRDNPHRAYITIIEGCDKSCAYCVVPFTRGPERSRTSASVIEEATRLADTGYTEIQLLGQNVNSYRDPSPAGWDFATLLDGVGNIPGIRRVRFTTSHPRDFVKPIVDAIDANLSLCNHVHLPVQSGSSRILEGMQRLYTLEQYMERIAWMRKARRDIAITTDIIVGFPGETERDFEDTLDLLDDVRYDAIFCFKYSPRPNTAALKLEDHIPEDEKARRLAIVNEKQRGIQILRNSELIGIVEEVHVEGRHHSLEQWIGRTSQNRILNFVTPDGARSDTPLTGTYVPVRVTRAGPNSLVGESVIA